jgi:hypothetical protein
MSVTDHRRLAIAAGATLLTFAVAGCSGLGRNAVGTVSYETSLQRSVLVGNPLVRGCHRLAPAGAVRISNRTLVDFMLYRTPNCSGPGSTYVASTFTSNIAPGTPPWRSYSIVH